MNRTYELPDCWVHEHETFVHTVYKSDWAECVFAPTDPGPALEMGYSSMMRYAVEHDLAHHIVAQRQGREHSIVVWRQAHGDRPEMEDPGVADEEHLANRLLYYVNFGVVDEEYGCLERIFGNELPDVARSLLRLARPWLSLP